MSNPSTTRFDEIKARMNAQSGKYIDHLKKYLEIESKYNAVEMDPEYNPTDDLATLNQIHKELDILYKAVKDPFQRFAHKIQKEEEAKGVEMTEEEKVYLGLLYSKDTKKLLKEGKLSHPDSLNDFAERTNDQRILISLIITLKIKLDKLMIKLNKQLWNEEKSDWGTLEFRDHLKSRGLSESDIIHAMSNDEIYNELSLFSPSKSDSDSDIIHASSNDRQVRFAPELAENPSPTPPVSPHVMPARDPRRRRPRASQRPRLSFPVNNIAQNTNESFTPPSAPLITSPSSNSTNSISPSNASTMRRHNDNFLLHNSELYPSGAIPNPPSEKPQHFLPTKRSKRRGGNKHTKLIYKGGSDDTISAPPRAPLPAGARVNARGETIVRLRRPPPICPICLESIEDTESIWSNITKCYQCKQPYHDHCIITTCFGVLGQTCQKCAAPHFCYGAKLKIELVELHNKYENQYKIEYKLTDEEINERREARDVSGAGFYTDSVQRHEDKYLKKQNQRITRRYRRHMREKILIPYLSSDNIDSDWFDNVFKGLELINYLPKRLIESLLIYFSGDNYSNEITRETDENNNRLKSHELYITTFPNIPKPQKFKLILDSWVDSISKYMTKKEWYWLNNGMSLDIGRKADFTNEEEGDKYHPMHPRVNKWYDRPEQVVEDEWNNGIRISHHILGLDVYECYSNNIIYHVIKGGSIDIIKYIYGKQPRNKYKGLGLKIFNQINDIDVEPYHAPYQEPLSDFGTGYQEYILEPSIWKDKYFGGTESEVEESLTFFNHFGFRYPPHYPDLAFDDQYDSCIDIKFLLNIVIVCALSIIDLRDNVENVNHPRRQRLIRSQRYLLKFFIRKFTSKNAIEALDCLRDFEINEGDTYDLEKKIRELINKAEQQINEDLNRRRRTKMNYEDIIYNRPQRVYMRNKLLECNKLLEYERNKNKNTNDDDEPPHNKQRVDEISKEARTAALKEKVLGDKNLIDKIIPFTAGAKKRYTLKKKRTAINRSMRNYLK